VGDISAVMFRGDKYATISTGEHHVPYALKRSATYVDRESPPRQHRHRSTRDVSTSNLAVTKIWHADFSKNMVCRFLTLLVRHDKFSVGDRRRQSSAAALQHVAACSSTSTTSAAEQEAASTGTSRTIATAARPAAATGTERCRRF